MKTLKNNKGFTLIEIVIVIVIIAILAAMLVPSMLSWIDSANQRTFLSAADSIRTGVNTVISEEYAKGGNIDAAQMSDTAIAKIGTLTQTTIVKGDGSQAAADAKTYRVTWEITDNAVTSLTVTSNKYTSTWTKASGNWTDPATPGA